MTAAISNSSTSTSDNSTKYKGTYVQFKRMSWCYTLQLFLLVLWTSADLLAAYRSGAGVQSSATTASSSKTVASRKLTYYHNYFFPRHFTSESSSQGSSSTALSMGSFNPFTLRNKNSAVRWYENDLGSLFDHIESQPLLTADQEVQYGRAIRLWSQVQLVREKIYRQKIAEYRMLVGGVQDNSTTAAAVEVPVDVSMDVSMDSVSVNAAVGMSVEDIAATMDIDESVIGSSNSGLFRDLSPEEIQVVEAKEKTANFSMRSLMASYNEVAAAVGCSVETLHKLEKYAEASQMALINGNMKLVLAVVSRYRTSGIANFELISEGAKGLARAAARYDYTRGFRFSTYATWYIHQSIADFVRWKKHPMKMPSRYLMLLRRVRQHVTDFMQVHGRQPSVHEIAADLEQSTKDISKVLAMNIYPTTINTPLSNQRREGMEKTVGDLMKSTRAQPAEIMEQDRVRHEVETFLSNTLDGEEREIVRLRLGLEKGYSVPLKEISRMLDISWKSVRNIEKQAMEKLMSSPNASILSGGNEPVGVL